MPERVLALDPGERVGWARADVAADGTWKNTTYGITGLRDMAIKVAAVLIPDSHMSAYDVVVCEDWRLYATHAKQMVGSSFPSVKFIGAVQLCCWLSGTKLKLQGAREISPDAPAMKAMASLRPELHELCFAPGRHDDNHHQDALAHLWAYTFKNKEVRP